MDVTSAEDHEHRSNLEVKETYVAPDTKSSTVLALVKLERAVIKMAEATTIIAIRRARLESALMMTIGTRRETTTNQAISVRVKFRNKVAEKMDTLGSRDMSHRR